MKTRYVDETHEYFIDDERVPSVTEVLKPLSDFSHVNPDVLSRAARFGTAAHQMAALHLTGRLDEDALDPGLQGCLEALKRWLVEVVPAPDVCIDIKTREVDLIKDSLQLSGYALLWRSVGSPAGLFIEQPIYSKRLKLAGTPDLINAHEGCKELTERRVLVLRQDGSYEYVNARRKQDDAMFRKMLEAWHYNANMDKLIKGWKGAK